MIEIHSISNSFGKFVMVLFSEFYHWDNLAVMAMRAECSNQIRLGSSIHYIIIYRETCIAQSTIFRFFIITQCLFEVNELFIIFCCVITFVTIGKSFKQHSDQENITNWFLVKRGSCTRSPNHIFSYTFRIRQFKRT